MGDEDNNVIKCAWTFIFVLLKRVEHFVLISSLQVVLQLGLFPIFSVSFLNSLTEQSGHHWLTFQWILALIWVIELNLKQTQMDHQNTELNMGLAPYTLEIFPPFCFGYYHKCSTRGICQSCFPNSLPWHARSYPLASLTHFKTYVDQ